MLLGCCHCEAAASSSSSDISSSGSGSAFEGSYSPFTCADDHCIGGVSAVRYRLNFDIGVNNICGSFYRGDFDVVAYNTFVSGLCAWKSAELRKKNNGGSGCSDYGSFSRFTFTMAQASINTPATGQRYALCVRAARQITLSTIQEFVLVYAGNLGNSAPGSTPTARINCIGAITLPLFARGTFTPLAATTGGSTSAINTFRFGVTNTNPYGADPVPWSYEKTLYPSTVTLTPI